MEKGKIVAYLNGKKTAITKQCDDKEVRPIKRNIYLPLYGTPTIGNYVSPKPLEKCIPYEEANAPIRAISFNLISCSQSR